MKKKEQSAMNCPFCGCESFIAEQEELKLFYVACAEANCLVACSTKGHDNLVDAVKAWNERKSGIIMQ